MITGFMGLRRICALTMQSEPQTQTDRANELNNVARHDLTQPFQLYSVVNSGLGNSAPRHLIDIGGGKRSLNYHNTQYESPDTGATLSRKYRWWSSKPIGNRSCARRAKTIR